MSLDNEWSGRSNVADTGQIVRRNRQLWWIAVLVILSLTAAIMVIYSPEMVGLMKEDFNFQLKTYLFGLSFLVVLFCIYVLQTSTKLESVKGQLHQKEIENIQTQSLLLQVQERSNELLRTKEVLEKEISERKQAEERLSYLAYHDSLTDLPNRTLFMDRLDQVMSRSTWRKRLTAVLFFDLDQFKQINDTLGHDIGDLLLKAVAERLQSCVRDGDTVARFGGDEFAVILVDVARVEDVPRITRKIIGTLSKSFMIKEQELFITTSIGISLYPTDGDTSQALLKAADMAMYRAKAQGRNNYQYYHPAMNATAVERMSLETGLRQALDRNELLLHYQPQLDLRTRAVIGMEAVVRWQHPYLGLVPPSKFIPLAEETGLILPIGEWVVRTACRQTRAWQAGGFQDLRIAVNLSARQFQQKDLAKTIGRILRETGLDPHCVELELTESIFQNTDEVKAILHELNTMGVDLSIDDFGTGYSSLSYLKRFPIQMLKIDQSFVRNITTDPDVSHIVKAIITLAHSLQLKAVAEGVETSEQLQLLRSLDCDRMQGYVYSPPIPAEEATRLLAEGRHLL